ncbi:tetratricopeptide (TPR) repeat protein [Fontibacillus solani]|uniref:Tetratricopeptide (TPR) repeat protein n=1 Tax=Fontibacillus solani TaxID=1572857 RepID=A0A7W3SWR7_9BACL|nr:tetratricopeptide repeat protein [Fontibacillus solani]MBA9087654.1 tetratricopeptide (TPR) repeat protein [Fontibacillus solani]
MSRKEKGINPKLITVMTGVEPPLDETPTAEMLPGCAARMVAKRIKKVEPACKPNKQWLRCKQCGNASVYDIGMTVFNGAGWLKIVENSYPDTDLDVPGKLIDYAQFTGYIRCAKCNGAGAWEFTSSLFTLSLMGRVMRAEPDANFMLGLMQLYDGTTPQWVSEGEERFLERLEIDPTDSHLWNKLGNLYYKGGRPELAAAVFEHVIEVDASHVESHYSLADLLLQIGEPELAAEHFRMTLVYARAYTKLDALKLRNFLADSLCKLLDIHHETKEKVPFLPTEEEIAVMKQLTETAATATPEIHLYEFDLQSGDRESFLPVAEMYMGMLTDDIPEHERKLRKHQTMQQLGEGGEKAMSKDKVDYPDKGWGSERQPIIVKVRTEERAAQVARVCDHFNWYYIMGMEFTEDLSDLKKALKERFAPANIYDPCPCGSEEKYKFCCAKTMTNFDLNDYLKTFTINSSS